MSEHTNASPLRQVIARSRVTGKLNMKAGWTEMRKWDTAAEQLAAAYETLVKIHAQISKKIGTASELLQSEFDLLDEAMGKLERTKIANNPTARDQHKKDVLQQFGVARALLAKLSRSGDQPPDDQDPTPAKIEKKPKRPQTIEWAPAGIRYGTALAAIAKARVAEGNRDTAPIYDPPLDATVPPAGDTRLTVFVAGNDEYRDERLGVTLRVLPASLVVSVVSESMAQGEQPRPLRFTADGLVGADTLTVVFNNAPTAESPINLDGYEVTPEVTFTSGSADNYDIELQPGRVAVTSSYSDLETEITRLWKVATPLRNKDILKRLEDIQPKYAASDTDPKALSDEIVKIAAEIYEATYEPVTNVIVTSTGGTRIDKHESLALEAELEPATATVQGVEWHCEPPGVLVVSQAGVVTRALNSCSGGTISVLAVSNSREKRPGALVIEVAAVPESVTIDPPGAQFLDTRNLRLTAAVEPPNAPQDVVWTIDGASKKKNTTITPDGVLTITAPDRSGGSRAGKILVIAKSQADPTIQDEVWIPFGGYGVAEIRIEDVGGRQVAVIDGTVTFAANVRPAEAAQGVDWSLESGDNAEIEAQTDTQVTVKLLKGGEVTLVATATDGTGVIGTKTFGVKIPTTSVSIEAPRTTLDLNETLLLKPRFEPPGAKDPVQWRVSDPTVAQIDKKGVVTPLKAGNVSVTAETTGLSNLASDPIDLEVTIDDAATLSPGQFEPTRKLIEAYARNIGIIDNETANKAYASYLFKLRQDVDRGIATNLATVKQELIALRDKHFTLSHMDWLLEAGFSAKKNCMLRDESTITIDGFDFDVHVTMFDHSAPVAIGSDPLGLIRRVYRVNAKELVSLHVTAYVFPNNTDDQIKAYISGLSWKPSPGTNIQKWQHDPGFNFFTIQDELLTWLQANMAPANQALTDYYDTVKQNDSQSIGAL
jgi:hypothetical protein